ncbi:MAG: hypothetical protein IPL79_10825 [Myxococcales bacterium]|nr:hypothetical protein [Myxococcales bacterium]
MNPVSRPLQLCQHLAVEPDDYTMWFTGIGLNTNWVCGPCAKAYPAEPRWELVSDAWFAEHCDDYCDGVCGQPEVLTRATSGHFVHEDLEMVDAPSIVDAGQGAGSSWILLLRGGELRALDVSSGTVAFSHLIRELGFEVDEQCGLCVSPAADYAVIYQGSGSRGALVDLATGAAIRQIDRGDYRPQNSVFPVAFARQDERTLLVCGSDWNRLELIDVAANRVLSDRPPIIYSSSEPPEHYLDYFHGLLSVSPDSTHIVDGGWVWGPAGKIQTWSLVAWRTNPWESESGPTLKTLTFRHYHWGGAVAWIDGNTVVVYGWGDDDAWLVPAALCYDVRSGELLRWFAGPQIRPPRAWPPRVLADSLIFDHHLFAVSDTEGTTVWDVGTGERIAADPSLRPRRYHRSRREFLTFSATGLRLSRFVP